MFVHYAPKGNPIYFITVFDKKIKNKLESNLTKAPLFNTKLFTKNIETAYKEMYERYDKGLEPDHIYVG